MDRILLPLARATVCIFTRCRLALAMVAAVLVTAPAAGADPPNEIHVTRQATVTPKGKQALGVQFEAELTLHPAGAGALQGEGKFHCTIRAQDGGFVLEADHAFSARGTWENGRVRISGPERLKYVCKKSHFDPANPGPNPEGAWKPGDTDTFDLAKEFYTFDGTLKDGRYEPPEEVMNKNDSLWRITTRMTATGGTPTDEDKDENSETQDDDGGDAADGRVIWKDAITPIAGVYDEKTGHNYSLNFKVNLAMYADGKVTARASNIQAENYGASDEDIPAPPDIRTAIRREVPYPMPIRHEWLSVKVEPIVKIADVQQEHDSDGNIRKTWVHITCGYRLTGIGKKHREIWLGNVLAQGWTHIVGEKIKVDHYGPAFNVEQQPTPSNFYLADDANFTSSQTPGLNKIPKEKFRVGTCHAAVYPTAQDDPPPPAQKDEDEFPERTYLKSKSGHVGVRRAGGLWVATRPNMELGIGDTVKTLADGKAEVVLAGTAIVRVKPDTEFTIPTNEGNTEKRIGFIKMVKGFLWARAKRQKDSLKIATPMGGCGARGTEFTVELKPTKAVDVPINCFHCYQGEIEVWLAESEKGTREKTYILSPDDPDGMASICLPLRTALTVAVYLGGERSGREAEGVTVLARKKGSSMRDAVRAKTDRRGRAMLLLPEPDKGSVQYDIVARSERHGAVARTVTVTAQQQDEVKLVLEQEPAEGPNDNTDAGPLAGSFAGDWDVVFYATPKPNQEPTHPVRWKIVVAGAEARTKDDVGRLIRGPLSGDGRVWNAKLQQGDVLVMQFRDLQLSPDGNRFEGLWGGNVWHGNAIIGTRVGTQPDEQDTPAEDVPKQVSVELKSGGERRVCRGAAVGTTRADSESHH